MNREIIRADDRVTVINEKNIAAALDALMPAETTPAQLGLFG